MSAPEGLLPAPLKKRRGRPAKSAVDHQTSQCVELLSSKLANLSGIRSAPLRASKTASPFSRTIPLLFHVFVGAVSQRGLYMYL